MKKELRARLLAQRNALPAEYVQQAGLAIQDRLITMPVLRNASRVLIYVSMGSEVCTDGIIQYMLQTGKKVAVPYLHEQHGSMDASEIWDPERELILGKYDTRVPKPEYIRMVAPQDIDAIIVPAIAFDLAGNRLGYGGGYYDRYLKRIAPETVLIGINYAIQMVEKLPTNRNDMPVDIIVHEKGIIHTANKETAHR